MFKQIATPLLFSALVLSPLAFAESGDQIQQVIYQCERDVQLPVTYVNTAKGSAYAVLQIDGQQIPMSVAVSASGARYESIDDQRSYSWHTKSNQGVVGWKSIDKQGVEILLLSQCSTAK